VWTPTSSIMSCSSLRRSGVFVRFLFTAPCIIMRSWDRMLSVCLSVTLVDHDQISWKSWKLIARTISPTSSLFVAQRSSIRLLPREHGEVLGRKCSLNTYVHNVRLNWVNRESRDLRWKCGCLFTFVGASRGHLCDSTAFLLYLVRGRTAQRGSVYSIIHLCVTPTDLYSILTVMYVISITLVLHFFFSFLLSICFFYSSATFHKHMYS